jgi:Proto-chlorophyllide reductase 57 kD subunit
LIFGLLHQSACRNSALSQTIGSNHYYKAAQNMNWTAEAEAKLKEIPFFVRPAARKKIEKLAQEMGATEITPEIYAQAKSKFG